MLHRLIFIQCLFLLFSESQAQIPPEHLTRVMMFELPAGLELKRTDFQAVIEFRDGRIVQAPLVPGRKFSDYQVYWSAYAPFDWRQVRFAGIMKHPAGDAKARTYFTSSPQVKLKFVTGAGERLAARLISTQEESYTPFRERGRYYALPELGSVDAMPPVSKVRVFFTVTDGMRANSTLQLDLENTDGYLVTRMIEPLPDNTSQQREYELAMDLAVHNLHRVRLHFTGGGLKGFDAAFDAGDQMVINRLRIEGGDPDLPPRLLYDSEREGPIRLGSLDRWQSPLLHKRRIYGDVRPELYYASIYTGKDDLRLNADLRVINSSYFDLDCMYTGNRGGFSFLQKPENWKARCRRWRIPYSEHALTHHSNPHGYAMQQLLLSFMCDPYTGLELRSTVNKAFRPFSVITGWHFITVPVPLRDLGFIRLRSVMGDGAGLNQQQYFGLKEDEWDMDGIVFYYVPGIGRRPRVFFSDIQRRKLVRPTTSIDFEAFTRQNEWVRDPVRNLREAASILIPGARPNFQE